MSSSFASLIADLNAAKDPERQLLALGEVLAWVRMDEVVLPEVGDLLLFVHNGMDDLTVLSFSTLNIGWLRQQQLLV